MLLPQIVKTVNRYLAGEMLTFNNMVVYLDEVVDEINVKLSSTFPTLSEAIDAAIAVAGTTVTLASFDYAYFPDNYIRTVLCKGAAYKFFTQDEEGMPSAEKYGWEYTDALFYMQRDYISSVPVEYQSDTNASVVKDEYWRSGNIQFDFSVFKD
jgi:hypothetical protein